MSDNEATPVVDRSQTSFGLELVRIRDESSGKVTVLESFGLSASMKGRLALERYRELQERAKRVSEISSPVLLRFYGARRMDGKYYVEREDLPGGVYLVDYLKNRTVSPETAVNWILHLAELCMQYDNAGLNIKGISDRNILVTEDGDVRVVDPGISESLREFRGDIEDPDNFLAPEAITEGTWTAQSSMFVLGILLYELLTGVKPFDDPAPENIVENILQKKQVDPRYLNPEIGKQVADIVDRLLQKQPGLRYSSLDELCSELKRIIAQRAFTATAEEKEAFQRKQHRAQLSDKAWQRKRWLNRNRAAIIALAVIALAFILLKVTSPDTPPVITPDMTAEEVVSAYYAAYADSDPTVLEEILAKSVEDRRDIITRASAIHVVLKMQEIHRMSVPVAGAGEEEPRRPFVVENLQITPVELGDSTARFVATYTESFVDQNELIKLSRRDDLVLSKIESVWRITSLESTVLNEEREPFQDTSP